ncbi:MULTISPECIES: MurR/RpiR family transcriptional regulator [Rhodococcus]|uniref:MurR/RpiR family transcriptional regulator n=1 Tax=Rhodococcus oxybenzonivorans TaxID=1990687 RepID=A0AAE4UZX5_9NOCA|nr:MULTISPECIES: MurR/RpiR family transcriptional regulator [Rhodococcus]MDV7242852.1 MurR/RpiR family transcriptional regulator [Rhodococcus oxybenzonivorans]MDV7265549.1 MurR/RpiR family transcriptional regulator [Rhodococcus oxybenzonivorans]MDV7275256.1 MurR/RpiR family transcriptional regulator [Rhodococcus oxybenzonivorans]MDV7334889.1 MurR/RpiR family transcriptional regulator [Rhodococcus oxybenzonivorans]MDV7345043.1 MurR/RpiR family transcriptional regulator [Rhodococcus oxybenzonivo
MTASPIDPPVGATLSAIRAVAPKLAPSERRVADVCVERPQDVAWWSAADVAEHAGTSTATVIRACQNLGFKGFQHLRMLLLRDLGSADPESGGTPAAEENGTGLVRAVFAEVATDLAGALAPLDEDSFERAVTALAKAERVLVVGNGASGPSAAAVAVRFILNGRHAEAPTDAVIQQLTAGHLTSRDVCLAVSDSGLNSVTLRPVEAARTAGATVIGVTSYARSTLVEKSDIGLVIGGGSGPWGGLGASATVVQLAFLISLQIAVCRARGGSAEAAAETFKQIVPLIHP